jgi:hypothetical protein
MVVKLSKREDLREIPPFPSRRLSVRGRGPTQSVRNWALLPSEVFRVPSLLFAHGNLLTAGVSRERPRRPPGSPPPRHAGDPSRQQHSCSVTYRLSPPPIPPSGRGTLRREHGTSGCCRGSRRREEKRMACGATALRFGGRFLPARRAVRTGPRPGSAGASPPRRPLVPQRGVAACARGHPPRAGAGRRSPATGGAGLVPLCTPS